MIAVNRHHFILQATRGDAQDAVLGCGTALAVFLRPVERAVQLHGQAAFELRPIESWTWVMLAARRDVFVSGNGGDRVMARQVGCQVYQGGVLRRFKSVAIQPFEFDTDGVIVAVFASAPA